MSDKLKPCPFCGGEAEFISGVGFFCVSCSFCCGETNLYNTGQEAIEAWNKRNQPTFTPNELDEIRKALEAYAPKSRKQWELGLSIVEKCKKSLKGFRNK